MMNYKGYIGKVEFDYDNMIFSGEVINTRTVITFHGTSVEELKKEFRASVDDYLEWCKEDGIEPERPYSGKFNVAAMKLGISLNAFIEKSARDELKALSLTV